MGNLQEHFKDRGTAASLPRKLAGASSLDKSLGRLTKQAKLVNWPLHKHLGLTEPEAPLPKPPLPLTKRHHRCSNLAVTQQRAQEWPPHLLTASAPQTSPTFPSLTLVSSSPISGLSIFTFSLSLSCSFFLCVPHTLPLVSGSLVHDFPHRFRAEKRLGQRD